MAINIIPIAIMGASIVYLVSKKKNEYSKPDISGEKIILKRYGSELQIIGGQSIRLTLGQGGYEEEYKAITLKHIHLIDINNITYNDVSNMMASVFRDVFPEVAWPPTGIYFRMSGPDNKDYTWKDAINSFVNLLKMGSSQDGYGFNVASGDPGLNSFFSSIIP